MRTIGWMIPMVVLAAACQKSPGLFDNAPADTTDQGLEQGSQGSEDGAYGDQQTSPYGTDQGTTGAPGTQGNEGMQGGMQGDQTGQMGQTGQYGQYGQGEVPQQIQTLQENVQEIRTSQNFQHTDLVQSLRDLSDAFAVLPNADTNVTDAVSRINSYADRIEAAGATSNMHGRWAKRALTEAVNALDTYAKAQNNTNFDQTVQTLTSQIDVIQDDVPFNQQQIAFADSYEQVSNALVQVMRPQEQIQRGTE
ncbi:MAG: hypothetical protein ACK4YP_14070 [Myxococcota bacterium]